MPTTPVTIDDVEVVSDTGLGYRVRIGKRELFIGRLQFMPGCVPPPVGCRGAIVILREAARDLGLISPEGAGG
jgi:hypothetical protein